MDMDMGHTDDGSSCVVSMLWNWNVIDTCFISSSWHVRSRGAFAASCIGVLGMMFLLEFLRKITKDFEAHIVTTFHSRAAAIRAAASQRQRTTSSAALAIDEHKGDGGETALPQIDTVARLEKGQATPACCQGGGPPTAAATPIDPATTGTRSDAFPIHRDGESVHLRATALQQLIRSVLYMCTFTLAYFVMLLAMYYNGYLLICIFLGSGLAHFLINGFEMDVPAERLQPVTGGEAKQRRGGGALDEPTVCCG